MRYGYFDQDFREYVITDPHTPTKWINYIGTRSFGGFVDHTGGALICKDDPTFNRITKYLQQMPASDFKGETLYLRIKQDHGYKVFSPFFVPTLDNYDKYECRVGLGYTHIISEIYGLRTDVTIFVPVGETREIRDIKITNISKRTLEVDIIPLVEYTHPDALKQFTNADWIPQTMQSRALDDGNLMILVQYPFMNRDTQMNFLTSNFPASSYETDRKKILGGNEYGSFRTPLSLLQPELSNSQANRGDNIAALLHHLGMLEPGETRRLITQLGQAPNLDSAHKGIAKYRQPEAVDAALTDINNFWSNYLSTFQVKTPDESMDIMLNIHNPYQCYVTKTWSRYLSYYQLGLGSRGIGIRDSFQDVLSVLAAVPDKARELIRTLLSFQKRDGSSMHQFNPLTMEGSVGDSAEMEDRPHYYSDDHLWGVLAVTMYLKETGDLAFLQEVVPFYDKDKQGNVLENGTVLEHLERGLSFTRKDTGKHGLPLLGFADWNDTVNLPTGAESLFTANLYGKALSAMIALLEYLGDEACAREYCAAYDEMRSRFESTAWDGEWYVRYFDDEGNPLGSSKNIYGQIYLNGQSWPVISGFASPERGRQAMDSVYKKLNTKFGIKLSAPGFNGYDPKYGGVTTYPPGAKENGGIFLHPNPWAMIAETLLGNGDRAYEYYAQINPAGKNEDIEIYECEPYVYAQNILGDEHPQFGLGRNSWLSGTASWCYQAATQWILGIRPEYSGLRVDPCIPPAWSSFSAARRFRGQMMRIVVHNPENASKGVVKMTVDGNILPGNLIPTDLTGDEHHIEVWLGK
jgi:cellobiose phosphorylase